jgi:hypothetical protein
MFEQEWRHFCAILAPRVTMPSFLEIVLLLIGDIENAFSRWWRRDRGRPWLVWKIPIYWLKATPKDYFVIMAWKIKQLLKLSLGWWDRDCLEAFHVRDKVRQSSHKRNECKERK